MKNLAAILKRSLEGAEKVAVLGIGSDIRGDDAAGILVIEHLQKIIRKKRLSPRIKALDGGTAPENLTGEIKNIQPSHLIIIDSADLTGRTGKVAVLNLPDVVGVSFCTHQMPLTVMIDYLVRSIGCKTVVIGIKPKNIAVGSAVSKEVLFSAKDVAEAIASVFHDKKPGKKA